MWSSLKNYFWNLPERTMEAKKNMTQKPAYRQDVSLKPAKYEIEILLTLPKQILVSRYVLNNCTDTDKSIQLLNENTLNTTAYHAFQLPMNSWYG
jgi:hypothetical protein